MTATLNFDDIRPYRDDEVPEVLESLLYDDEFLWAIKSLRMDWLPSFLFPVVRPILRAKLRRYTDGLSSVADFQNAVEDYLERGMKQTSDSLTYAGDDRLVPGKQYLFMSNHRDIVLDPALCNLAVHRLGRKTFRIAIGDNLLTKPFAERLMRINKSFIVKRALGSGREWLKEMKKLSTYIRLSITQDGECVWIAQREGRAKDGIDASDPALIKMLTLSKEKQQSFSDAVKQLNILPVAVSYEWDPCDLAKARELATKQLSGEYEKGEHEDIESIAAGILGDKGKVDLCFGVVLAGDYESAEEVAQAVDAQIIAMYQIHASNLAAYMQIYKQLPEDFQELVTPAELEVAKLKLGERTAQLNDLESEILLQTYANPVVSRLNQLKSSAKTVSLCAEA